MEETNNNEAVKDTAENKAAEESKATAEITETDNKVPEGNEGAKETKDTDVIKDTEKNRTDEENSTADATPEAPTKETKITKKTSPLPIILAAVAVVMVAVIIGSVVLVQSFSPEKKSERQCISAAKFLGDLDFEQAVAAYKTAIEIDPNNEAAVQGLYDAYMAWAKSLEDEGNDTEATKRYEDAIATNPALTDAYYALADIYIRTNNTDALLKLYEKASASLAGEDTAAFKTYLLSKLNDRITELIAVGDTDSALLFLAAIEKIDIDSAADARENIVNELLASGTEEGYRKALDIDPESESAYLKLIDYYLEKEDYEKAGKILNEGEDAVDSATLTAKRSEIPYVIANNIKVETAWVKSVSFDAYPFQVIDYNGYRLDSPEIKVDEGVCTFNIDSITEESTADGMKTITINASSSIQPKFNVTWDGNFDWSFRYTLPGIGFYDYYSGKLFNSRNTEGNETYGIHTEFEWKNITYDVYKETKTNWTDFWDESTYVESEDGWSELWSSTYHQTYTITVPEDYDGLMIYLERTSDDGSSMGDDYYTEAADAKRSKKTEAWLAEEHYLLDPDAEGKVIDPEDKYFFRITDETIADFNK